MTVGYIYDLKYKYKDIICEYQGLKSENFSNMPLYYLQNYNKSTCQQPTFVLLLSYAKGLSSIIYDRFLAKAKQQDLYRSSGNAFDI